MNNMTDIIEQYIRGLLNETNEDYVTLKRSNVAEKFDCVPSQLNYVIKTRFTPEQGFIIESKRGGGGFIRITKITLKSNTDYIDYLIEKIEEEKAENIDYSRILKILRDDGYISQFDYHIMNSSFESMMKNCLDILSISENEDKNKQEQFKIKSFKNSKELLLKFLTIIKFNKEKK